MPKFISTDWKVVVNSVDLSDHAFDVQISDEKEQIDVSGFSATGRREFLPGIQDQTIAVSFLQDFASAEVHATIWPIYEGGLSVPDPRPARLGRRHRLDQPDLLGHGQLLLVPRLGNAQRAGGSGRRVQARPELAVRLVFSLI